MELVMLGSQLMQHIKELWGERIAKLPQNIQAFVAALIANESGGGANAKRFEPAVFTHLSKLYPAESNGWLTANATSWGLTQIMGYHVNGSPEALCDPDFALLTTVGMIKAFQDQYKLAPTDYEGLFRCWNTGRPNGVTFDPGYVTNGLERMHMWNRIVDPGASSGQQTVV